uniref:Uncharacterized protein n=1 Tax=Paulinella longichromatophora TaxID=1708747 RepID=A0A2H4ZNM6_9EUKA|nr:hypothetical protein PLO_110 [Paulinella longichromatophora]
MRNMNKVSFRANRQLNPLPKGLLRLYGFIAVLVVLIPEWVAGSTLIVFPDNWEGSNLPLFSCNWYNFLELRLATMPLSQLRILAYRVGLRNYSRLNRERLISRLIKCQRHNSTSFC